MAPRSERCSVALRDEAAAHRAPRQHSDGLRVQNSDPQTRLALNRVTGGAGPTHLSSTERPCRRTRSTTNHAIANSNVRSCWQRLVDASRWAANPHGAAPRTPRTPGRAASGAAAHAVGLASGGNGRLDLGGDAVAALAHLEGAHRVEVDCNQLEQTSDPKVRLYQSLRSQRASLPPQRWKDVRECSSALLMSSIVPPSRVDLKALEPIAKRRAPVDRARSPYRQLDVRLANDGHERLKRSARLAVGIALPRRCNQRPGRLRDERRGRRERVSVEPTNRGESSETQCRRRGLGRCDAYIVGADATG